MNSVELIADCRRGDETAAAEVFARYVNRLRGLVRARLSPRLAARFDSADVVMSALRSFFVGLRDDRFQVTADNELWQLLVEITLHKLYRQAARHGAQKRSVRREERLHLADGTLLPVPDRAPGPDDAAAVADELAVLLARLPPMAQRIVELRLEGAEILPIAAEVGVNERTVRRWLARAGEILKSGGRVSRPRHKQPPQVAGAPLAFPRLDYGDFMLQKMIGAGASGKVYRALDRRAGNIYALKFLRKALLVDRRAVNRFLDECSLVRGLEHPHVMPVLGCGRTPAGGYFFAMPLAAGDLQQFVGYRQSVTTIVAWLRQAASGLLHAHAHGVVHCDLKPSNLLLSPSGEVLVTDFGLAQRMAESRGGRFLVGTPAFMAPEQVSPALGDITPRTDVYGLGAALYALLTGEPPFVGPRTAEVLDRVVSAEPARLSRCRPRLPRWLSELCLRCLAKRPADRFATMNELLTAVDAAL